MMACCTPPFLRARADASTHVCASAKHAAPCAVLHCAGMLTAQACTRAKGALLINPCISTLPHMHISQTLRRRNMCAEGVVQITPHARAGSIEKTCTHARWVPCLSIHAQTLGAGIEKTYTHECWGVCGRKILAFTIEMYAPRCTCITNTHVMLHSLLSLPTTVMQHLVSRYTHTHTCKHSHSTLESLPFLPAPVVLQLVSSHTNLIPTLSKPT